MARPWSLTMENSCEQRVAGPLGSKVEGSVIANILALATLAARTEIADR